MSAASIAGLWQIFSVASAAALLAMLGGMSGRTSVLPNATTPLIGVYLVYYCAVPNLLLTCCDASFSCEEAGGGVLKVEHCRYADVC